MKNIIGFILSGLIGGAVVLAGNFWVTTEDPDKTEYTSPIIQSAPVSSIETIPSQDLTIAAAKATPTVVHIKAAESESTAQERYMERRRQQSRDTVGISSPRPTDDR